MCYGLGGSHIFGKGVWRENVNDECKIWGGVVQMEVNENYQGTGKDVQFYYQERLPTPNILNTS